MTAKEMITFPPGVLGADPLRLPFLVRNNDLFAISKPVGIGVSSDPFDPDVPLLLDAIAGAIASGKKQLADLGIGYAGRVHGLDSELDGVVIFATNKESEGFLRNAIGSRQCEFVFELLAETQSTEVEFSCDLPLVKNDGIRKVSVSHAAGKKSSTTFTPDQQIGNYTLWEARTPENRPHQVRIHAAESGIRVAGEGLYARVRHVYLSDLKRGYRHTEEKEEPLYKSVSIRLKEVVVPQADGTTLRIEAPRPRSFAAALKAIARYSPKGGLKF